MTTTTTHRRDFLRPRREKVPGTVYVLLLVGGSKGALCNYTQLWDPDCVLVIDVLHELPPRNPPGRRCAMVKLFALAAGQTADSLFQSAPAEQRKLVRSLAGMDAANGLGQVRGIGAQAVRRLLRSAEWRRAKRHLIDELRIAGNGGSRQTRHPAVADADAGQHVGQAVQLRHKGHRPQ